MQKTQSVDEYIESFPEGVQEILQRIRRMGKEIVKDADEVISYGIPTLKLNGKFVFYFSGYKNHISLYPIPPVPSDFLPKIEPFRAGKGTLQFQLKDPIPYDLIKELIHYYLDAFQERAKK